MVLVTLNKIWNEKSIKISNDIHFMKLKRGVAYAYKSQGFIHHSGGSLPQNVWPSRRSLWAMGDPQTWIKWPVYSQLQRSRISFLTEEEYFDDWTKKWNFQVAFFALEKYPMLMYKLCSYNYFILLFYDFFFLSVLSVYIIFPFFVITWLVISIPYTYLFSCLFTLFLSGFCFRLYPSL
jgi:hypothetical protein